MENDKKWKKYLQEKLESNNLDEKEKAYLERIIRVLAMPDLTKKEIHPVSELVKSIENSEFYKDFQIFESPEIVSEFETFDLFNFPENHVARRPADSYFLQKSEDKDKSILLRPHTTVAWFHYLINGDGKKDLENSGDIKILSSGKVYRVDELDKTHHECFHQIDGFRIVKKSKKVITKDTLKEVLKNTIKAIFGEIEFRFNEDNFPYTTDSLEVEVKYNSKWLEVLGAGVVHPSVLEKLGLDSEKYNGWAFGFGIERLAMALKGVPDIRIFWSEDDRILSQWGTLGKYREVSNFPPVYKDLSFIVPKKSFLRDLQEEKKSGELELTKETESDFFAVTSLIRDIAGNLIEEVKIIDIYENDEKFGEDNKSITMKIVFRSIERTLTDEEINKLYFEIRKKIKGDLSYKLR